MSEQKSNLPKHLYKCKDCSIIDLSQIMCISHSYIVMPGYRYEFNADKSNEIKIAYSEYKLGKQQTKIYVSEDLIYILDLSKIIYINLDAGYIQFNGNQLYTWNTDSIKEIYKAFEKYHSVLLEKEKGE
jgi:hypothetical protein